MNPVDLKSESLGNKLKRNATGKCLSELAPAWGASEEADVRGARSRIFMAR